jgi:predicted 3-demethylubiquinone-9 3-methyltransferase (glyoxalase superfamily)
MSETPVGDQNAMQIITPHLWFDKQAREAAEFYVSLFPGSKITNVTTLSGTPSGDCAVVSFELAGQPFMVISAGPLLQVQSVCVLPH